MFKNWSRICGITNPWLKMLISTTDDPEILTGLQHGFPNFFSQQETVLKIPLSAIAIGILDDEGKSLGSCALEKFNLPFFEWGSQVDDPVFEQVPSEWFKSIEAIGPIGYEGYDLCMTTQHHFVTWNGEECVIFEMYGPLNPTDGSCDKLTIVPSRFIDFEA